MGIHVDEYGMGEGDGGRTHQWVYTWMSMEWVRGMGGEHINGYTRG